MTSSNNARLIDLGDDLGAVVVKANRAQVTISADGHIAGLAAPVNDGTTFQIGDEIADGTILAGYYEGKPLYTTPSDAPGRYDFNKAAKYAKNLDAHGHRDFHVPSKGELDVLWTNRNQGKLKGTFNQSSSKDRGWYWSSTSCLVFGRTAWAQRFSDAEQNDLNRFDDLSLRCVR